MGVHGLTTYLRENKRVLANTLSLSNERSPSNATSIPAVVDGWSFIYDLYEQSRIPWVYGGEYDAFMRSVANIVKAWIAVGMHLYFVFDGPAPELKIPTLISRLTKSNIQNTLLFFRTSPASRSTPRFLHESKSIPPFVYQACIYALRQLALENPTRLEILFADNEGDPFAVELAGRLGGYVIGSDSDFVILNTDRYAGYIPLDEMVWLAPIEDAEPYEDSEFTTVRKPKGKAKHKTTNQHTSPALIPPSGSPLTLSFSVYIPSTLSAHLKIPTTLLPLLGALVGNDFSNSSSTQRNVQSLFFERHLTLSQRITRVASTLTAILSASSQKRAKAKHQVGSVMDLIDRTVTALLVRPASTIGPGETDAVVERIVNATLQYAIDKYDGDVHGPAGLWVTDICPLHNASTCPLPALFSHTLSQSQSQTPSDNASSSSDLDATQTLEVVHTTETLKLYLSAYRAGKFTPKLLDVLSTRTFWPRLFLEHPDVETVARSIGRPVRLWVYALLEDGCGLPEAEVSAGDLGGTSASEAECGEDAESDDDELIDVEEVDTDDDEDLLAPLRGELERLRTSSDESAPPSPSTSRSRRSSRRNYVVEYVRRGTRMAPEEVEVPDIERLLSSSSFDGFSEAEEDLEWTPIQLCPPTLRIAVLLHALQGNNALIKSLPASQLHAALALRWVVQTLHARALESGSREREAERWTKREAKAFIASFKFHSSSPLITLSEDSGMPDETLPQIHDRTIQLTAQAFMALDAIHQLVEVLLLTSEVPSAVHLFSGKAFHALLAGDTGALENVEVSEGLWLACVEGLEGEFGEEKEKGKKVKKAKQAKQAKKDNTVALNRHKPKVIGRNGQGGMYELLANAEA